MTKTAVTPVKTPPTDSAQSSNGISVIDPPARNGLLPIVVSLHHAVTYIRPKHFQLLPVLSFIVLVVVPTIFVSCYVFFYASDRYTSEFRVTVRAVEPLAQASGGLVSLLGLSSLSQASTDSHAVVQYLESPQALDDLSKTMSIRQFYSSKDIDWWSRLEPSATVESMTRYWSRMLDVYYENTTGTIIVKVTAFSPKVVHDLAKATLALSESLVNGLSERSRNDTVSFAETNLRAAEARLTEVSKKLKLLRDTEGVLDPKKAAETSLTLSARIHGQISTAMSDLEVQRKYLSEDAPPVQQAREHLKALNNELIRIDSEATSKNTSDGRPLSSIMGSFEQLENERVFAERAYQSALTASEAAKLDANRQQIYLATIVPPQQPQEPSFPKPAQNIFTTFAMALAAWVIAIFGFYAIREHV